MLSVESVLTLSTIVQRPGVVPFRQSKLTELFKNTFESDGKVVSGIPNANQVTPLTTQCA